MWVALAESHLAAKITPKELTGFREAASTPADTDPVSTVIAEVAALVRGYCSKRTILNVGDTTVPMTLLAATTDIAVWEIQQRAGGMVLDPHGARKAAYDKAMELLAKVGTGEHPVEQPDVGDSSRFGSQVPTWCNRKWPQSHHERGLQ